MPTVTLSIFAGVGAQLFDNNGDPLSGGRLYTYLAGTTTPATTYTSQSGSTPHTNPIILDAAGKVPGGEIWLDVSKIYKIIVKTSTDVLLNSYDNLGGSFNATPIVSTFTGDGTTTSFSLTSSPTDINTTNVFVGGVYQQKSTYTISSNNLVFSSPPPPYCSIEVLYT